MAQLDKSLLAEYRKLAKRADERLVRLEQSAEQRPGFNKALRWAYNVAKTDVKYWSGDDGRKPRYNRKPPATNRQLEAKILDIKHFLDLQTSTVKGIKAVYQNNANTFNEKYGTNFTAESFQKFWDSGIGDELKHGYGYETAYRAIGKISQKPKEIIEKLEKAEDKIVFVDDKILNHTIKKLLNDYGKDILNLF